MQQLLDFELRKPAHYGVSPSLESDLAGFSEFGTLTKRIEKSFTSADGQAIQLPVFVNEFWTARQRQAHSLHEVSYRACFKPQLPRFFIERLTHSREVVYDPFMGRGTTLLESALLGRIPYGCDINPLSPVLIKPRLLAPTLEEVGARLSQIDFACASQWPEELLAFYHPETLRAIASLKAWRIERKDTGKLDRVDEWIGLVTLNRLTGHSPGFFSVYTLPPNQAVSVRSQLKINARRNQEPPFRDVSRLILKKSAQLLSDCDGETRKRLASLADQARILIGPAETTPEIPDRSVSLVVTSPPFLDIVQYAADNWLRCWFLGIDAKSVQLTVPRKLEHWRVAMTSVFRELHRVLKPRGHVAFEVGEVHAGTTRLEEAVIPCGVEAGLNPLLVLINDQKFTKTANCWGIKNMQGGTNTNRIVVFQKPRQGLTET